MHIVSYRGPGQAGGVSAALARAFECNYGTGGLWWHLSDNEFEVSAGAGSKPSHVASLSQDVIKGHYRYCNDFLWPMMHDLPQYAHYVVEDRANYNTFNQTIGWCLARANSVELPNEYFVQDYQLALVPDFLRNAGFRSVVFWHIPWPVDVSDENAGAIEDIARGLLASEAIGFHTEEYASNFQRFVAERLPEFATNADTMAIWAVDNVAHMEEALAWAEPDRYRGARPAARPLRPITRLIVAPLGIDYDHWSALAARQQNTLWHPSLMRTPFVLSVDRADYTKGVTDRIHAIDRFFELHPEWKERIVFAQVCGKTRSGLPSFDGYWQECQQVFSQLETHWATEHWSPLVWLQESLSHAQLAHAYSTAAAMLITAVRDGLNLTAKEYIACQGNRPGVLALSDNTGAFTELGNHCLKVEPGNVDQTADAIFKAVTMSSHEKAWRAALLKDSVRKNSLSSWWFRFADVMNNRPQRNIRNAM